MSRRRALEILSAVWGQHGAIRLLQAEEIEREAPPGASLLERVARAAGLWDQVFGVAPFEVAQIRALASRALAELDLAEARRT